MIFSLDLCAIGGLLFSLTASSRAPHQILLPVPVDKVVFGGPKLAGDESWLGLRRASSQTVASKRRRHQERVHCEAGPKLRRSPRLWGTEEGALLVGHASPTYAALRLTSLPSLITLHAKPSQPAIPRPLWYPHALLKCAPPYDVPTLSDAPLCCETISHNPRVSAGVMKAQRVYSHPLCHKIYS